MYDGMNALEALVGLDGPADEVMTAAWASQPGVGAQVTEPM